MNRDARSLVEGFCRAINERNLDRFDDVVASDYRQREPSLPQGRVGLKAAMSGFLAAFADLSVEIDELLFDRSVVGGSFRWRGTHTGEFLGIAPTNRHVEFMAADFWVVRDEMLAEHWGVTDVSLLIDLSES
ncbi:ester cyclase [Nocardioides sp. CN2-186]|uniref:ester cyclase n=1 Tax=Nocardioides tweenelious TaxID=3156607 RepID=UPI0032B430C3